ncbi:MAG: VCBS repeat-containing protein [Gammaproteobacteria bacterium]|nr:VCBS repeat-containing protein [Gammaproteobacteria bacterium]
MLITTAKQLILPELANVSIAGILGCLLLAQTASGQSNYVSSEIEYEMDRRRVIMEDLNGDTRLDLVVSSWKKNLGRELLVYFQLEDGRFSPTPKPIEIKTEIIAVGFADLRDDPGKELVLFANNGVFSLSTAIDGYTGNLKPLFEWKLIADVPDPDRVQYFRNIRDLDGDGFIDLLVPGEKTFGLFRGAENESFTLAAEFSTLNLQLDPSARSMANSGLSANIAINAEDGIKLEVHSSNPTPFTGFVENWQQPDDETSNLLQAENWMPSAILADFNGDKLDDIIFLNIGLDIRGQVNLLFQSDDGSFQSQPDWQGSIDTRGDIMLANLDGDGLMDIVRLTGEGNEWDAYLFRNNGGRFDFEHPSQVMRFSGYDVELKFVDLDNSGRPELNVSYYTIPVVDVIRNASIVRTQLLYSSDQAEPEQLFSRRPQFRLEESFSASNVRGLAQQMSLRHDVDGDGLIDALYITEEGALAGKKINTDLRIVEEPFWEYVPTRTILAFSVQHLNGDNLPDLILRHASSVTLLIANP